MHGATRTTDAKGNGGHEVIVDLAAVGRAVAKVTGLRDDRLVELKLAEEVVLFGQQNKLAPLQEKPGAPSKCRPCSLD